MGRAQVMQAEAAGIEPSVDMNPILLKPTSDVGSQVIVNGTSIGNMPAKEYFQYKKKLVPQILEAFGRLEAQYDIIVIEGAGSPAEINLKENDIVNMGLAKMADAPVLLVGDIDRGGVFAQLYGTVALLEEEERARIKGLIINKFRGDRSILEPGIAQLEEKCRIPVVGVTPYMDLDIEDEDSLSERLCEKKEAALIDIAVIHLPHLSNFTDFAVFERMEGVSLRYVKHVSSLHDPDMIIVPGTKNTIGDLQYIRQNGLEASILKCAQAGTVIFGICGGYQMLGASVSDPYGSEGGGEIRGMGLLPAKTVFCKEKTRTQVTGTFGEISGVLQPLSGMSFYGYEIHMGETKLEEGAKRLTNAAHMGHSAEQMQGCQYQNIYGSYIHGIFDADHVAERIAEALAQKKGIAFDTKQALSYKEYKDRQYQALAAQLREHLDMRKIYAIMEDRT
jgi:adenosylcobyric acid synthase